MKKKPSPFGKRSCNQHDDTIINNRPCAREDRTAIPRPGYPQRRSRVPILCDAKRERAAFWVGGVGAEGILPRKTYPLVCAITSSLGRSTSTGSSTTLKNSSCIHTPDTCSMRWLLSCTPTYTNGCFRNYGRVQLIGGRASELRAAVYPPWTACRWRRACCLPIRRLPGTDGSDGAKEHSYRVGFALVQ